MKKWYIWGSALIIIALLFSSVDLLKRYNLEKQANQVEIAIPYDAVAKFDNPGQRQSKSDATLKQLIASGVTTLVLNDTSIHLLQINQKLYLYNADHLPDTLRINNIHLNTGSSVIVFADTNEENRQIYSRMIMNTFQEHARLIQTETGKQVIILDGEPSHVMNQPIGIDFVLAKELQERYSLEIVPLYTNKSIYHDSIFMQYQFHQLSKLHMPHLLFGGNQVLGYPSRIEQVAEQLRENHLYFTLIKSQAGASKLAKLTDYRLVRTIFLEPGKLSGLHVDDAADIFELSVRERAIQLLYFPFPKEVTTGWIDHLQQIIQKTTKRLAENYAFAQAVPIADISEESSNWHKVYPMIGITFLTIMLIQMMFQRIKVSIASLFLSFACFMAWVLPSSFTGWVESGYALAGAIVAPTLAMMTAHQMMLKYRQPEHGALANLWKLLSTFLISAAITGSGICFVVSLLSDLPYLTYVQQFRGVKLLFVGPIVLITLYLGLRGSLREPLRHIYNLLVTRRSIKHWSLYGLMLVLIAGAAAYFVIRSGNDGVTLPYEDELRKWLDQLLGVRPRTKEILLGHPLFIIALYWLIRTGRGVLLIIPATIGQLSMMNTFTHLHTPLHISIQRSVTGIIIGFVIGLLCIGLLSLLSRRTNTLPGGQVHDNKSNH